MYRRRSPRSRSKNPRPIRITERDKQILETIHAFDGLMSRKQIDQLFFSGKGRTQPRQRMRALFDHGYVSMPDTEEIHRVPVGEVIYWLDKKGAKLVAGLYGETLSQFPWRRKPRWSMLEHDLTVNDIRIAVREACEASSLLSMEEWISDSTFRADPDKVSFKTRTGQRKSRQVIPNAFFSILKSNKQNSSAVAARFSFLLEVDMATESNPRFVREKTRAGKAYVGSKAYRERFGVSFGRYLIVTTSEQRLNHLKRATERAGGEKLFYFTTIERIKAQTVLAQPIWKLAGSDESTTIIPDISDISNAARQRTH